MAQVDLSQYLQQQAETGTKDSEGGFTVSHTNAAKKLARFALPRTYAWVTKFLQAAVAWECQELCITQSTTLTTFHFVCEQPEAIPSEQDLVNTMLSGKIGGELPIDDLCVGLRACVEQARLSFLVVVNNGSEAAPPVYAGRYFSSLSEQRRMAAGFNRGLGITVTVAHVPREQGGTSLPLQRFQLKIVEELDRHCFLSPIPIRLDGLRLDQPLRSSIYTRTDRFRPLLLGGVSLQEGQEPIPLPSGYEEKHLSLFTHNSRALRTYGRAKRDYSAAFLIGWHLPRILGDYNFPKRRYSCVHWVRRGAVVETQKLPIMTFGLACQVFVNGDELNTDLTGFQIVESERKAELETEAVRGVARGWFSEVALHQSSFREDRDPESGEDVKQDARLATKARVKVLVKGTGAGLFLTLLSPPLGIPATLAGILAAYIPKKNVVDNTILKLRDKFEDMMEKDQSALLDTLSHWTRLPPEPGQTKVEFVTR